MMDDTIKDKMINWNIAFIIQDTSGLQQRCRTSQRFHEIFLRCVNNDEAFPSPFFFNPSLVQSQKGITYCAFSPTFPSFHAVSNFYHYFFPRFTLIYFSRILFFQSIVTPLPIPSFPLLHSKILGQQCVKEFYNYNISNCKCV